MFKRRNKQIIYGLMTAFLLLFIFACEKDSQTSSKGKPIDENQYFAHQKNEDNYGIITPWYTGQNGQLDERVKVSARVLKRFPWTTKTDPAVPHYIPGGQATVSKEGKVQIIEETDKTNGDVVNRAFWTLLAWTDYYAYTGDPIAFVHGDMIVNHIIKFCLASATDAWPEMVISIPFKGQAYGKCNGQTQIDFAAQYGYALMRYYQMNPRADVLALAKKWGDLFVKNMNTNPALPPWPRFIDPEKTPYWADKPGSNLMTGSMVLVLFFLNELANVTNAPDGSDLKKALLRGENYLRDVLLAKWYGLDTWGRHFWDGLGEQLQIVVTDFTAIYMLQNRQRFPTWKIDVRRLLDLNILRTSGYPAAKTWLYSGAWLYPESTVCCTLSIGYSPMFTTWGSTLYGALAEDEVVLERARRMSIISTYDFTSTGYTEDLYGGGQDVYKYWLKIAYANHIPFHLKAMAYNPEVFAPQGENRLLSTSSVVQDISYKTNLIEYKVFDASSESKSTLRISFLPAKITADSVQLLKRNDLNANGYTLKDLNNGDYILQIRHDSAKNIKIEGPVSAQQVVLNKELVATQLVTFVGNQFHIIATMRPDGGQAKLVLDGVELIDGLDLWSTEVRTGNVFTLSGLKNSSHVLEVIPQNVSTNPRTTGNKIQISEVWWNSGSYVKTEQKFPDPRPQRVVLGYVGRDNLRDSSGVEWSTGLEIAYDFGGPQETFDVDRFLPTFWVDPLPCTGGDCIYSYGIHSKDFMYGFTTFPGKYTLRMHFHCGRLDNINSNFSIMINDSLELKNLDLNEKCQGNKSAVVLIEKNNMTPKSGTIQVRFTANQGHEAYISAMELLPVN